VVDFLICLGLSIALKFTAAKRHKRRKEKTADEGCHTKFLFAAFAPFCGN
jgi:hypothetical protein